VKAWALGMLLVACRASGTPKETVDDGIRHTAQAQELNTQGADLIASDPEKAEVLLRAALAADFFFGPAHNNLGVLHLQAGHLHAAAEEFEQARKLMPGNPDPRMNLALTLEQAGKIDEAIATYRTALEVSPGHIPTIQALARLEVTSGRKSPELEAWLDQIVMQGETEGWRRWASSSRLHLGYKLIRQ